ncbi:hypothetical protein [Klebsiella phage vB_KpnS-VAC11]|uniref:Uncharacterized protein n=1 Tax=Klebsiella phage vB_KpnS-VAC11 TaxID=2864361 RepID=A0AAE7XHH2_9CAUD|nr:hypothetical protein [Klebsiella phage vB_KpnS-VAC11]
MQSPSIPLFRIGGIISNRRNSIFCQKPPDRLCYDDFNETN